MLHHPPHNFRRVQLPNQTIIPHHIPHLTPTNFIERKLRKHNIRHKWILDSEKQLIAQLLALQPTKQKHDSKTDPTQHKTPLCKLSSTCILLISIGNKR